MRFWDERGSSLLFCCYVQGSLYTMWKFRTFDSEILLWKWRSEKCGRVWYSNLLYLAYNTCHVILWPLQYVRNAILTQFQRDSDAASLWLLTCQHASNFWGAAQCWVVVVTGLDRMCNVTKRWPKVKFIGNDQKLSEMIGKGQEGSD